MKLHLGAWVSIAVLSGMGCGDPLSSEDASVDASRDSGSPMAECRSHADCADDLFCNGAERCMPDDPNADPRGCAVDPSCAPAQTCDEDADRCGGCDIPDADGDGHRSIECAGDDCDDADASRYPGNSEVCDPADRDEDCDPETFGFRDGDSDGVADARCCNTGLDAARYCGTDCNDAAPAVHPMASDTCNGRDDNCDGEIDEGVSVTLYPDTDGDMFGDPGGATMTGCAGLVPMYVTDDSDCDDGAVGVHPGAAEACDGAVDDDCDGTVDNECVCAPGTTRPCAADGVCAMGTESCMGRLWGDCSVVPAAFDTCDGRDEDCNGVVDDGLRGDCWPDGDRDGYAESGAASSSQCLVGATTCPSMFTATPPSGLAIDCDDDDSARSPVRTEVCNALRKDEDCDGSVEEGVSVSCYPDGDNDGFAATSATMRIECPDPGRAAYGLCPVGTTDRAPTMPLTTDCDDSAGSVKPSGLEQCNGIDDDCNGVVDDGTRVLCWDGDTDDDTFTVAGAPSMMHCRDLTRPAYGHCPTDWTFRDPTLAANQDCAPMNEDAHPGAIELCNAIDEDCDGRTDDVAMITCYTDMDDDTYPRTGATATLHCPAAGRESVGGCPNDFTNVVPSTSTNDCADSDPSRHPGITEVCNDPADDRNCNLGDEGQVACWVDLDGDGRAAFMSAMTPRCPSGGGCPVGYTSVDPSVRANADCDDSTTTGTNPLHSSAPIRCYRDVDDDSYALSLTSGAIDRCPDGPAYGGCPTDYTTRASLDCCDTDSRARPASTTYYATANACGSFDYNCSTTAERRYPSVVDCESTPGSCGSGSGWESSIPSCGVVGAWGSCGSQYDIECRCLMCTLDSTTQTQTCR